MASKRDSFKPSTKTSLYKQLCFIAQCFVIVAVVILIKEGIIPHTLSYMLLILFIVSPFFLLIEVSKVAIARIEALEYETGKLKEYIRILDVQDTVPMSPEEKKEIDRKLAGITAKEVPYSTWPKDKFRP